MKEANFLKRILSLFYDSIIVIGLIFTFSLLLVVINGGAKETSSTINFLQRLIMILTGPIFYCYFWTKNDGQTLGMQAWKIKVLKNDNTNLSINDSLKRCLLSFFLFPGYLWIIFDKKKRSWADIVSDTKIIKVGKN
tara:strand:+ start:11 stop:421 length:411 start_codon:yes stop_codon:yes gene_type:complete